MIVIVARNNLHLTKKAINSALAQVPSCGVVVVDNHSEDGTASWLRTKPVAVCTLRKQESLAACWNIGIQLLWKCGHTRVLVLNNDVEIPPTFCDILSLASYTFPFVTGAGVNQREQAHTVPATTEVITDLLDLSRPHPHFSAFMITKQVTDKVGWFDESYYPAYCEDSDYHVRMHRAGMEARCLSLPFYHHSSQTLATASSAEKSRICRGADENREKFRKKYGCLPNSPEYAALFV